MGNPAPTAPPVRPHGLRHGRRFTTAEKSILLWRKKHARPKQITPEGDWRVWLIMAGRGFGKTRTGAEDVKAFGLLNARSRIAVGAPTFADGRDTCIEGESGLLSILPADSVRRWNRSIGELYLTNGTMYKIVPGEKPAKGRGPQWHRSGATRSPSGAAPTPGASSCSASASA